MPDVLPWYMRWGFILAAFAAAAVAGGAKVYQWEEHRYAATIAKVKAAGDQQNAKTAEQVKAQKTITADVARAFDSNVRSIDAYYARRLRNAIASRSKMPAVSNAPGKLDATAPDVAATPEYIKLTHDCALTTAQLVNLQNWIIEQGKQK